MYKLQEEAYNKLELLKEEAAVVFSVEAVCLAVEANKQYNNNLNPKAMQTLWIILEQWERRTLVAEANNDKATMHSRVQVFN